MTRRPPGSTLFPSTTLFRSLIGLVAGGTALWALYRLRAGARAAPSEEQESDSVFEQWPTGALVVNPRSLQILDQRSEEHTSELQSRLHLVCRLLLETKKTHL